MIWSCSAGRLRRCQGIIEGYGELRKPKGHWGTLGRVTRDWSSLLLNCQKESCSLWSCLRVSLSMLGTCLWNYVEIQCWLWGTGVLFRKPPTHSAALTTKLISDYQHLSQMQDDTCEKEWKSPNFPFRNKVLFNPTNLPCIFMMFIAMNWASMRDRKEGRHGTCFRELAGRQVLCLKREESNKNQVTSLIRLTNSSP